MRATTRLATGLGAAMILAASAMQAAAAPKPHIQDPLGDANFVNDQGTGDGSFANGGAGADAGTVSDLTAVTFSNDKKNLYVNIETEAAPPAASGIGYRVRVNPDGTGGSYCLFIEAFHPGANNDLTAAVAQLRDACNGGEPVKLGIVGNTVTVPRKASKAFAKGGKLTAPQAQSFLYSGSYPTGAAGPMVDVTEVGTDYKLRK